ncbi:MAG: DUF928 domain-containing protein [Desmonostoc vinosum HA7617-LM4]|jgi:hypothetical protein|nr:DUF928 domain-containing protein [Desmonostoc vinosum HA7617-LM4]
MKPYKQKIQFSTALGMLLISNMFYHMQLQALPIPTHFASIKFTPPPPPPDRGAAGTRGGTASRSHGCSIDNQTITALVPMYEQTVSQRKEEFIPITKVWGLTNLEHPYFLFFVPYKISSIANIEFVLKEETNNQSQTLYRSFLTPPASPGIIKVDLPTTTPLQIGKMYQWFFKVKVKCNPRQPITLDYVEGWVQRVSQNSALTEQLKQATPQQKVTLYAANGIWYDALMTLAELRFANTKDESLLAKWISLLNSVGLEKLANQPLINCCQPSVIQ